MTGRIAKRGGLFLFAAALAMMACNEKTTSIQTLLNDPGKYDGKTVRVTGEVQQAIGALGYGAYEVKDNTAMIPVVTPIRLRQACTKASRIGCVPGRSAMTGRGS